MTQKDTSVSENKKTILLVEDDRIVAKLLNHLLTQKGFIVQLAGNGREAIESLDSQIPTDLALLDIMLPVVDGFEVLTKIRSHQSWKQVPTIMLTSKAQDFNIKRAFESGATDYLTKPFKPNDLMQKINRLIKSNI